MAASQTSSIELLSTRYRVVARIGSGGAGEVYLARDTKLDRDVAVKVLSDAFANDPERLQRFWREAKLLAAVRHHGIAAIYDLEETPRATFLILEHVPGMTLAARLQEGPMGVRDALRLFVGLAEAIEAAHQQGVIHRDLKPGNVMITPEGGVKVLDFGLARSLQSSPRGAWEISSLNAGPTADGVILGTLGYMSPEQARGRTVDRRTDIWAFGCMLYEALTGQRAFDGGSAPDTLARILREEPDWAAIPAGVPERVLLLIQRCLDKDSRRRLRDIGDAWVELDQALRNTMTPVRPWKFPAALPRTRRFVFGLVGLAGLGVAAWAAIAWMGRANGFIPKPESLGPARFFISLPESCLLEGVQMPAIAISRDGALIAYTGEGAVVHRRIDDLRFSIVPLPGQPLGVFFSPDGRRIGFGSDEGTARELSLDDGTCRTLPGLTISRGATWIGADSILYAPSMGSGLRIGGRDGRASRAVTTLDSTRGEMTHRWPHEIRGTRHALFVSRSLDQRSFDEAEIIALDLDTGERRLVLRGGSCPSYLPPDILVFARGDELYGISFDEVHMRVRGAPVKLLKSVSYNAPTGASQYAVSATGTLAYVPMSDEDKPAALLTLDRSGRDISAIGTNDYLEDPRIAPEGKRVAFTWVGAQDEIGISELDRPSLRRLTFSPEEEHYPLWTRDGRNIVFASIRKGKSVLCRKRADGTGLEELVWSEGEPNRPTSWSADGEVLLYDDQNPASGSDVRVLEMGPPRRSRALIATPFEERGAVFSPNGRWIAYESNETGRYEIYVQSFPRPETHWQISRGGARCPRWSRDGRELLYCDHDNHIVGIGFNPVSGPRSARPAMIIAREISMFDVTPDGNRLVVRTLTGRLRSIVVVMGWKREVMDALRSRAAD